MNGTLLRPRILDRLNRLSMTDPVAARAANLVRNEDDTVGVLLDIIDQYSAGAAKARDALTEALKTQRVQAFVTKEQWESRKP